MAKITIPNFEYENKYASKGYKFIAGIDEVGRGAWAGPLVAAAVILPELVDGARDSKMLSPQRRENLAPKIRDMAVGWGIGSASVQEIDNIGLQNATFLAYERALSFIVKVDFLLIDAYHWKEAKWPYEAIIKGDSISSSIAAASIVAKVARDEMMRKIHHENDSRYCFDQHKGYGTKLHKDMLTKYGVSNWHRKSYTPIKEYINL